MQIVLYPRYLFIYFFCSNIILFHSPEDLLHFFLRCKNDVLKHPMANPNLKGVMVTEGAAFQILFFPAINVQKLICFNLFKTWWSFYM